ncbi:M14 family murein peptide amidase A [Calditrichota bacterium GD2]
MHANFKGFYALIGLIVFASFYFVILPYFQKWQLQSKTIREYDQLKESNLPWKILGYSEKDNPIYGLEVGAGQDTVIIFGAFHGDEQVGFHLVLQLADTLYQNPSLARSFVLLVPVVNPDGLLAGTRTNANGVDLNRNFPTEDWSPVYTKKKYFPGIEAASEKETQLVIELIDRYRPDRIVSIHADLRMNNYNGPAKTLAETMAQYNGYPVKGDVGYPTPGSFGTFAGNEMQIPVVTLELPGVGIEEAWQQNFKALLTAINFTSQR